MSLQSYYAARADEYDAVYRKPERQPDLRSIEQWLPRVFAGADVLEVACGTGHWTQFIAARATSVFAIDAAAETLRIAERKVTAANVTFALGDAYALPRDLRRSAAFAGFWFSHVEIDRQHEFLAGLGAALAPGARVVLLDNLFVEGSSSPIAERDAAGNTFQTRRLADGTTHRVLKNFPPEARLRGLVAEGLGDSPAYRCWQHYWAFEYRVAPAASYP